MRCFTPPLWRDIVKNLDLEARTYLIFFLECTDSKNVIFEKNPLRLLEVGEFAEVKQPQNPK